MTGPHPPRRAVAAAAALCLTAAATARGQTPCDFEPLTAEVILNTDSTQVAPKGCPPYVVTGGVFVFRNVTIHSFVTVRGQGSRPMIWVALGDFRVNGVLTVDGGGGAHAASTFFTNASTPTPGGSGVCGGGGGGDGSPNTTGQSLTGEPGFGPGRAASGGGGGGLLSFNTACDRGSGGGGGSFGTTGDPHFKAKAVGTSFVQQLGAGGYGCQGNSGAATRTLAGGGGGPSPFVDSRDDNDFFGTAVDVHQAAIIRGELPFPLGGAGGGGGGDRTSQLGNVNWLADNRGGGGGAGGGVLLILAAGVIEIGGRVSADGGNGGGGAQAGGNNQGGGGGGGSGGMVVLYSSSGIVLHTKGETYANDDYDFPVSADGGVGTQSNFGGLAWTAKYPPPGGPPVFNGALWDNAPSGGMGGMGLVQMFAPAGTNADGTNTILDDYVTIVKSGRALTGVEKVRYLAWRGFPNAQGVWVDDAGNPTYGNAATTPGYPAWARSADDEGDVRPAPILLPLLR